MALTVSIASNAEESSASLPNVVGEDAVYFEQVGWNIAGFEPVASADIDRVAVATDLDPLTVEVLEWDGREWRPFGRPIHGGYPKAMSADGNRLVVGHPRAWRFAPSIAGVVRMYQWNGSDWSQMGDDIVGDDLGDALGWTVDVSADGGRVVVGAPRHADGDGHVRVVEWDGSTWSQLGTDLAAGPANSSFGWAVAIADDGERIAVSERNRSEFEAPGIDGAVRVYDWDGLAWNQVGTDIEVAGDDLDFSGSADRLAVGLEGNWDIGPVGRAWVFDLTGGDWAQVDYSEGRPARTVSLSTDGTRLVYSGNRGNGPIDDTPGTTVVRDELGSGWADVGEVRGQFGTSSDGAVALSSGGDRMVIGGIDVRVVDIAETPFPPLAGPVAVSPARLYDSRFGAETVDGVTAGRGRRPAGSVTEIPVIGRGGVPDDATGVVLDVVAVNPGGDGHLTVFPCDEDVPLASSLNYTPGQVIANSVYTGLSATGSVCVATFAPTDLVVDVTGYAPLVRSTLRPVQPSRLVDSRTGEITIGYETWVNVNRLQAGRQYEFAVLGIPGSPVPSDAESLMLNVTAVDPAADGFLAVYPCGTPRPLASSVNYAAGQTIANLVFTGIGEGSGRTGHPRRVCISSSATTDVVVDVTGFTLDTGGLPPVFPARLLDSRPGESTVDGIAAGIGRRPAGSITEVVVAGRGGVDADATGAILNVVAVNPDGDGHLTVFPCGTEPPLASNLNYTAGQVIANSAFTKLSATGTACIYTYAATDLVVDVTGAT